VSGKARRERAERLLAAADQILAVEPPDDVPVLLALLDLAIRRDEVRRNWCWEPVPGVAALEAAIWSVKRVLVFRCESARKTA
jgi:hypothetical protein